MGYLILIITNIYRMNFESFMKLFASNLFIFINASKY